MRMEQSNIFKENVKSMINLDYGWNVLKRSPIIKAYKINLMQINKKIKEKIISDIKIEGNILDLQ